MKEQNVSQQIEAFRRAVELDPNFVEAYYELGRACSKTGENETAKKYFLKAYTCQITTLGEERKARILYELAAVYRVLGEPKAAEDALRGAGNLTSDSMLKNQISLELGTCLFHQNRFAEALAELQRFERDDNKPAEKAYFLKLLAATEQAVEADQIYRLAEGFLSAGRLEKARDLFRQVDAKVPGFRDVQEKIVSTELALNNAAHENTGESNQTTEPGNAHMAALQHAEAKSTSVRVAAAATGKTPRSTPEASGKAQTTAAQHRLISRQHDSTAETATRHRTSPGPIKKETISPGPAAHTEKAQRDRPSASGNGLYNSSSSQNKKPGTEENGGLLQSHHNESAAGRPAMAFPKTEPPVYLHTTIARWPRITIMATALTLITFAVSFFIFVPDTSLKAWLFARFGMSGKASSLYEKLLDENPRRLWLYPALARLYDKSNRRDERAIKVYRMVQHLNINGRLTDALRINLCNKYLSEVETEPVRIEIVSRGKKDQ